MVLAVSRRIEIGDSMKFFGFDRTTYSSLKRDKGRRKWFSELREQRARDVETEMI
jgi:hypothetical protein